jgi:hypothetical protein
MAVQVTGGNLKAVLSDGEVDYGYRGGVAWNNAVDGCAIRQQYVTADFTRKQRRSVGSCKRRLPFQYDALGRERCIVVSEALRRHAADAEGDRTTRSCAREKRNHDGCRNAVAELLLGSRSVDDLARVDPVIRDDQASSGSLLNLEML